MGCLTGQLKFSEDLCCPEAGPCQSTGSGGDGNTCAIDCNAVCAKVGGAGVPSFGCNIATDGSISYYCGQCGVGRIALGTPELVRGESLGARLAHQAYYEAASVHAFARLAYALQSAHAPAMLVQRARRAGKDETRHAATFARLAREHGVAAPAPSHPEQNPTLFELALENATEGCVRETLGAFVARHQAEHAQTPELRAAFASIADDELEHAMFSWDLMAWFDSVLPAEQRAEMHAAYQAACAKAMHDVLPSAQDALDLHLGLPNAEQARQMFTALLAELAVTEPVLRAA
jgi:hypothetical protein